MRDSRMSPPTSCPLYVSSVCYKRQDANVRVFGDSAMTYRYQQILDEFNSGDGVIIGKSPLQNGVVVIKVGTNEIVLYSNDLLFFATRGMSADILLSGHDNAGSA